MADGERLVITQHQHCQVRSGAIGVAELAEEVSLTSASPLWITWPPSGHTSFDLSEGQLIKGCVAALIPMVERGSTDQAGIKQDTENEILEKAHSLSGPLSLGCHLLTYCLEFLGFTEIDGVARNQGLVSAVI